MHQTSAQPRKQLMAHRVLVAQENTAEYGHTGTVYVLARREGSVAPEEA